MATVSFLLFVLLLPHLPRPATGLLSHITHWVSDWVIIQGIRGRNKGLKKLKKQTKADNKIYEDRTVVCAYKKIV
jgi:hypothetical protein